MNHAAHGYWENSGHSVPRYDCLVGVCLVLTLPSPGTDTGCAPEPLFVLEALGCSHVGTLVWGRAESLRRQ